MRLLLYVALFSLAGGIASADSLTIDLPLVNGIPTLTGTPGEVVDVDAIFTPTTSLILGDVSISETTTEGNAVGYDTAIYYDSSNPLFAAQDPTTTPLTSATEGGLVTITFPDGAPVGISQINYSVFYGANLENQFIGFFDVDTELAIAPEPGTFGLMGLVLAAAAIYKRRQTSR